MLTEVDMTEFEEHIFKSSVKLNVIKVAIDYTDDVFIDAMCGR